MLQKTVNTTMALGRRGTISRQNPLTSIPRITEDNKLKCGSFAFIGSKPEISVLGIKDGAKESDVLGFAIFGHQMAEQFGNTIDILKDVEVQIVKRGYCFAVSKTNSAYGDNVFVNPKTGEIKTSSAATEADYILTGWTVETGGLAGRVIEISKI